MSTPFFLSCAILHVFDVLHDPLSIESKMAILQMGVTWP